MGQPLAASACDCELATGLGVDRRRIALRTFKATGSDLEPFDVLSASLRKKNRAQISGARWQTRLSKIVGVFVTLRTL